MHLFSILYLPGICSWMDFFVVHFVVDIDHVALCSLCLLTSMEPILLVPSCSL